MTEDASPYDLVVVRGPRPGDSYPLPHGRAVIGRSSSCDIKFEDPEVSARHLHVTVDDSGVRVSDAGSTNGTFVDGVAAGNEVPLKAKQTIEIGGTLLTLEIATPPSSVSRTALPQPSGEWSIPIGLGARGNPVAVDLSNGHLVVVGPYRSGRTEALRTLAAMARRLEPAPALHLFAPRATRSVDSEWDSVVVGLEAVSESLGEAGRFVTSGDKALVILDDADELLSDDHDEFERVLRAARHSPVRFAIATETQSAHRSFGGWFLEARKQKNALLLQPDSANDGDLFGVRLPEHPVRKGAGGGYLVGGERISAVQVATDLEDEP